MTESDFRAAVTQIFCTTGQDASVKEIAAQCNVSEYMVRKVVKADSFNQAGYVSVSDEWRESESRNYPGMVNAGAHKLTVYGPSRRYLAKMLNDAKAAV